jgi:anhydro-N-acetylmuramic acid kinase
MRVCGVMSGTSLDGIDVAIVDIHGKRIKPVAFQTHPYPAPVRKALLAVASVEEVSRLNFLLGELYAEAILKTCRSARVPLKSVKLCGLHGQTIFHEAKPIRYLGRKIGSTLQIGEAAVVAERTGLQVISNFRERDIAAGGQGAPLVPFVDNLLFRHRTIARVALNIGGIANITVIPAAANVIAFDTGPGNMVIDELVSRLTKGRNTCDNRGRIARSAKVNQTLLQTLKANPYFKRKPPKTAGREQFGEPFVNRLIATGLLLPDLIATATELTAVTIAEAIPKTTREIIAAGGGVHNDTLMNRLRDLTAPGKLRLSSDFGIDPDAKEAIAFAVLAYEAHRQRPANLPSATGAKHPVLLGKTTQPT